MNKTLKLTTIFCALLFAGLFFGGKEAKAFTLADCETTPPSVQNPMITGQTYTVTVTCYNQFGSWSQAAGYKIVSISSPGVPTGNIWGLTQVTMTGPENQNKADNVEPGQTKIFQFNVTAPASVGTYSFRWHLYEGNDPSMNGYTQNINVSVTAPPTPPSCTAALPDGDTHVGPEGWRYTYITGASASVSSVIFYAWSESGGQDDLIAWPGYNEGGGTWSHNIMHASHPANGTIYVHAYMYSNSYPGATYCDSANFTRIAPTPPTVNLLINGGNGPATVGFNGSATLTWSTTGNPNQCLLSPEVAPGGNVGASGTRTPTSIQGDVTYTITCSNAYGSAQDSVTATVPAPTVDLLANSSQGPISIPYGTAATISWTSSNGNACNVNGNGGLSGSFSTGALTSNTTYNGECYGDGIGSDSVTVNVQAPAAPTADIRANGSPSGATVSYNNSATISWTSTNSNSCSVSPSGWGSTSNNGVNTGNLTSTTTYTITCTGPGGSVQDSVTVTVNPPAQPTCTAALPDGDSAVGSEGSRYTYITGAAGGVTSVIFYAWSESGGQNDMIAWPGQNQGGGTWSINIPHASHPDNGNILVHVYMFTAYYTGGVYCDSANFVRVAPTPPSVDLLVNGGNGPISVAFNGTATLSWTTGGNPNQCLINPAVEPSGNVGPSGSRTAGPMQDGTAFTITCTSAYGSAQDTVIVNVNPPTIDMRANGSNGPIAIAYGGTATISWTSTNAHACNVSGNGGLSGSFSTGALTTSTTYTGECYGNGVGNDSVTVNVNPPAQPSCTSATPDGEWTIATTGTRATSVTGVANATIVYFATYTDAQGSGSAIWHSGTNQGGGTWTMNIPHASHPGVGNVNVHVYMSNTHYSNVFCDAASFSRRGYGTINVSSRDANGNAMPSSWTITCVLTNPACPTQSSGSNQTSGVYNNVPASSWTIVPAVIPGYTANVTQGTTQVLPNIQP